jgi:hypothetical protein
MDADANPQVPQRTGPTGQAVALGAAAVGLGYWFFARKSGTKGTLSAGWHS